MFFCWDLHVGEEIKKTPGHGTGISFFNMYSLKCVYSLKHILRVAF